mmetsp:Transcript_95740/g.255884  ORF Transcript_95740/g.255884 Transcript_95740/m.255884 type:complete len:211 (-) Transcript_95740:93-725(-)
MHHPLRRQPPVPRGDLVGGHGHSQAPGPVRPPHAGLEDEDEGDGPPGGVLHGLVLPQPRYSQRGLLHPQRCVELPGLHHILHANLHVEERLWPPQRQELEHVPVRPHHPPRVRGVPPGPGGGHGGGDVGDAQAHGEEGVVRDVGLDPVVVGDLEAIPFVLKMPGISHHGLRPGGIVPAVAGDGAGGCVLLVADHHHPQHPAQERQCLVEI